MLLYRQSLAASIPVQLLATEPAGGGLRLTYTVERGMKLSGKTYGRLWQGFLRTGTHRRRL